MLTEIILTVIIICICKYCWSIWTVMAFFKTHEIPHIQPLPIIGNLGPTLLNRIHFGQLLKHLYDRFPEALYVGFYDCMTPAILLRDPQLIKSVTIANFDHFQDNFGFTTEAEPLFNNSILSLKGRRWHEIKTLLRPSFTSKKLRQFFDFSSKCAEQYVAALISNHDEKSKPVELKEFTSKFTNDVMSKFSFGIDVNSLENPEVYAIARDTFNFNGPLSLRFFLVKNFRPIMKLLKITLFDKVGSMFYANLIKTVVEKRIENKIEYYDSMQTLIQTMNDPEAEVKVTLQDIQSQMFTFFIGGFDTTSTYLSFVLYILAREPEVQRKLQSEVDEVMKTLEGKLTFEDVNNMKYLNAVISEVGRLYPPIPFNSRRCTKRFELPPALPGSKPFVVEPGANITLPIFALHRDEKLFPEPDKFNPDRFIYKNVLNDMYIPFGLGPRMCLGMRFALMQMKVMVFHFLARYNLKVGENEGDVELVKTCLILMQKGGFRVEVERRRD